jgi:hypothetical protein
MVTGRCCRDYRSAGEEPRAVEPSFAAALDLFEVKLLQDLLDCGHDRALQHSQIRLLPRIDIEQDQFGQHSPGLVDEIQCPRRQLIDVVEVAAVLRVDQVAENSRSVGQVVEHNGESASQV